MSAPPESTWWGRRSGHECHGAWSAVRCVGAGAGPRLARGPHVCSSTAKGPAALPATPSCTLAPGRRTRGAGPTSTVGAFATKLALRLPPTDVWRSSRSGPKRADRLAERHGHSERSPEGCNATEREPRRAQDAIPDSPAYEAKNDVIGKCPPVVSEMPQRSDRDLRAIVRTMPCVEKANTLEVNETIDFLGKEAECVKKNRMEILELKISCLHLNSRDEANIRYTKRVIGFEAGPREVIRPGEPRGKKI